METSVLRTTLLLPIHDRLWKADLRLLRWFSSKALPHGRSFCLKGNLSAWRDVANNFRCWMPRGSFTSKPNLTFACALCDHNSVQIHQSFYRTAAITLIISMDQCSSISGRETWIRGCAGELTGWPSETWNEIWTMTHCLVSFTSWSANERLWKSELFENWLKSSPTIAVRGNQRLRFEEISRSCPLVPLA